MGKARRTKPQAPPFALASALTRRAKHLCDGLERGEGSIFGLVSPATADQLRGWFGTDAGTDKRFDAVERQAILNVIVAHEAIGAANLADLYRRVCPDALLDDERLIEVSQPRSEWLAYYLGIARGPRRERVSRALAAWRGHGMEDGPVPDVAFVDPGEDRIDLVFREWDQ